MFLNNEMLFVCHLLQYMFNQAKLVKFSTIVFFSLLSSSISAVGYMPRDLGGTGGKKEWAGSSKPKVAEAGSN